MNGVGTIEKVDCLDVPKINEPCLNHAYSKREVEERNEAENQSLSIAT